MSCLRCSVHRIYTNVLRTPSGIASHGSELFVTDDGDDCVQAQIAVYECMDVSDPVGAAPPPDDECIDLFDFLALKWNDLFLPNGADGPPLDFCDTQIRAAVAECPSTIVLPGDPTVPLG